MVRAIGDWRAFLVETALSQGPSFFVLLLMLYGLWGFGTYIVQTGIPAHLEAIQSGYQNIQSSHDKNLDRLIQNFDRRDGETKEKMTDAVSQLKVAVEELRFLRNEK